MGHLTAAALALVLVLVLVAACGDDERPQPAPEGRWTRGADLPLAPRTAPLVGWTGTEVLVIGGETGVPFDPAADSESMPARDDFVADGAAYDPGTDTWRPIADAPRPIPGYARSTMVGDTMVIQTVVDGGRASGWLSYDAGSNRWAVLPDPPEQGNDSGSISSSEGRVAMMTEHGTVELLAVATKTWTVLPPDPLNPNLVPQCVVAGEGRDVYVSGPVVDFDVDHAMVTVDRWDGSTWTRLPETGQIGCFRAWTGRRLVSADIQRATGMDGDPPDGGRLDPATGEWSALPDAPDPEAGLPDAITVDAAAGPLFAGWGFAYDDRLGSWTPFGRPDSPVDRMTGATWADGRLVVVGGLDEDAGYQDTSGLSNQTWTWDPPLGD